MGEGELEGNETNETNFTNQTNCTNEQPGDDKPAGDAPRVPVQLARLPASKLKDVYRAMELLEECGLCTVDNVGTLKESVKSKAGLSGECLPSNDLTSTYMAQCLWAWTRARWMSAVDLQAPKCSLSGASPEDCAKYRFQAAEQDEQASSTEWEPKAEKRVQRARAVADRLWEKAQRKRDENDRACPFAKDAKDHFEKWFNAMVLAGKQIQKLNDPDWSPSTMGVGSSPLFAHFPDAVAPKAPDKAILKAGKAPPKISAGEWAVVRPNPAPQVITVHLGGAGCGLGTAMWNRLFTEHKIGGNGRPSDPDAFGRSSTHFEESASGRLVPRAVFADMDSDGLSSAQETGCFAPIDMLEGSGSTNSNFAVACYQSQDIRQELMERLRQHAEKCSSLQGLMITHSLHGGTGGGLTVKFLAESSVMMGRKMKWNMAVTLPRNPGETSVSDSMNTVLALSPMNEHTDLTTFVDNGAMEKLCKSKQGLGISEPGFADYNALASRVLVSCTSPTRLGKYVPASEGTRCLLITDMMTNLCPYPRIHGLLPSVAPVINEAMADFATDSSPDAAFNGLMKGDLSSAERKNFKNIACATLCRNLAHSEVISAVGKFKSRRDCNFVDYVPTGFLVGAHRDPTCTKVGDVVSLFNNSAIGDLAKSWVSPLEANWEFPAAFGEAGMEQSEVTEAMEDIFALVKDYEEVSTETANGEGEEEEY